jgi:hypothetical protein
MYGQDFRASSPAESFKIVLKQQTACSFGWWLMAGADLF